MDSSVFLGLSLSTISAVRCPSRDGIGHSEKSCRNRRAGSDEVYPKERADHADTTSTKDQSLIHKQLPLSAKTTTPKSGFTKACRAPVLGRKHTTASNPDTQKNIYHPG